MCLMLFFCFCFFPSTVVAANVQDRYDQLVVINFIISRPSPVSSRTLPPKTTITLCQADNNSIVVLEHTRSREQNDNHDPCYLGFMTENKNDDNPTSMILRESTEVDKFQEEKKPRVKHNNNNVSSCRHESPRVCP